MNRQRNVFIIISGFLIVGIAVWYLLFYNSLSTSYLEMIEDFDRLSNNISEYEYMVGDLPVLQAELDSITSDLKAQLARIPYRSSYNSVIETIHELLKDNNLQIVETPKGIAFTPTSEALETKQVSLSEIGKNIIIEKFPVDIELTGNFINLGQFLDQLSYSEYRLTTSNVVISKGKNQNKKQRIKLIVYIYTKNEETMTDLSFSPDNDLQL